MQRLGRASMEKDKDQQKHGASTRKTLYGRKSACETGIYDLARRPHGKGSYLKTYTDLKNF